MSGELYKHNSELDHDKRHGVLLTVGGLFREALEIEDELIFNTNRLDDRLELRLIGSKKSSGEKLPFASSYLKLVPPFKDNYPIDPRRATIYIPHRDMTIWESKKNSLEAADVLEVAPDPKLVAVEINKEIFYIIESPVGKEYLFKYNRKAKPIILEWLDNNEAGEIGKKMTLKLNKIKDKEKELIARVLREFRITDLRSIKYKD